MKRVRRVKRGGRGWKEGVKGVQERLQHGVWVCMGSVYVLVCSWCVVVVQVLLQVCSLCFSLFLFVSWLLFRSWLHSPILSLTLPYSPLLSLTFPYLFPSSFSPPTRSFSSLFSPTLYTACSQLSQPQSTSLHSTNMLKKFTLHFHSHLPIYQHRGANVKKE